MVPFLAFSQEIPEENMINEPADTTQTFIKIWNLTEDFAVMRDKEIDTMKTQFQIYDPVFSNSIANAFLGNTGLQTQNLIFFNREEQPDFFFMRPSQLNSLLARTLRAAPTGLRMKPAAAVRRSAPPLSSSPVSLQTYYYISYILFSSSSRS